MIFTSIAVYPPIFPTLVFLGILVFIGFLTAIVAGCSIIRKKLLENLFKKHKNGIIIVFIIIIIVILVFSDHYFFYPYYFYQFYYIIYDFLGMFVLFLIFKRLSNNWNKNSIRYRQENREKTQGSCFNKNLNIHIRACLKCGVKIMENAIFCHNCGKALNSDVQFCAYCGVKKLKNAFFCYKCGNALKNQNTFNEQNKSIDLENFKPKLSRDNEKREDKPYCPYCGNSI